MYVEGKNHVYRLKIKFQTVFNMIILRPSSVLKIDVCCTGRYGSKLNVKKIIKYQCLLLSGSRCGRRVPIVFKIQIIIYTM